MTEFTKIGVGNKFNDRQLERLFNRVVNSINQLSDGYIHGITKISANYTAGLSDHVILVTTTSGGVTVTLPAAADSAYKRFVIKKITNDTNNVTINTASGNIDNAASVVFSTAYGVRDIVSDGSAYWVV
jgi:hypothetical protein